MNLFMLHNDIMEEQMMKTIMFQITFLTTICSVLYLFMSYTL